jgi:hypothetical protein
MGHFSEADESRHRLENPQFLEIRTRGLARTLRPVENAHWAEDATLVSQADPRTTPAYSVSDAAVAIPALHAGRTKVLRGKFDSRRSGPPRPAASRWTRSFSL